MQLSKKLMISLLAARDYHVSFFPSCLATCMFSGLLHDKLFQIDNLKSVILGEMEAEIPLSRVGSAFAW